MHIKAHVLVARWWDPSPNGHSTYWRWQLKYVSSAYQVSHLSRTIECYSLHSLAKKRSSRQFCRDEDRALKCSSGEADWTAKSMRCNLKQCHRGLCWEHFFGTDITKQWLLAHTSSPVSNKICYSRNISNGIPILRSRFEHLRLRANGESFQSFFARGMTLSESCWTCCKANRDVSAWATFMRRTGIADAGQEG